MFVLHLQLHSKLQRLWPTYGTWEVQCRAPECGVVHLSEGWPSAQDTF